MLPSASGAQGPAGQVELVKTVQKCTAKLTSSAITSSGIPGDPDYDRLWRLVNEKNHGRYDAYQAGTARPIPLVVVSPG